MMATQSHLSARNRARLTTNPPKATTQSLVVLDIMFLLASYLIPLFGVR